MVTPGIYDLTNYATLTNYPLRMVVQDMLWGASSFGISAFIYTRLLAPKPAAPAAAVYPTGMEVSPGKLSMQ